MAARTARTSPAAAAARVARAPAARRSPRRCAARAAELPAVADSAASPDELRAAPVDTALVIDVRDDAELEKEGAVVIEGSVHVPLNKDGRKQSDDPTTMDEFAAKCTAAGALPDDKNAPIITHCGRGGRGQKAKVLLTEMGYTQVINGGNAEYIAAVRAM